MEGVVGVVHGEVLRVEEDDIGGCVCEPVEEEVADGEQEEREGDLQEGLAGVGEDNTHDTLGGCWGLVLDLLGEIAGLECIYQLVDERAQEGGEKEAEGGNTHDHNGVRNGRVCVHTVQSEGVYIVEIKNLHLFHRENRQDGSKNIGEERDEEE